MKTTKFLNILFILSILTNAAFAQTETPPTPGAPRTAKIPAVVESKLPNGLKIAAVERKNVPLVTVELLILAGASNEETAKAGLANLTASMLTKGTRTKSATQIAEAMEFLGGSINAGAGWNNSVVQINVLSDKLDAAMAILSDVVLNPTFKQEELDLLKTQTLDGLVYNLKQPGFLANYVASKYSFDEHPAGGTPDSIKVVTRKDIVDYKKAEYQPANAVLIFTGDITPARARALAVKFFGTWRAPAVKKIATTEESYPDPPKAISGQVLKQEIPIVRSLLVVDLPNAGQASVNFTKMIEEGRNDYDDNDKPLPNAIYFPANVLNSVLGGGYSSRLNQEIRIKRGLSYGAGSAFTWRADTSNFSTRTQTKNESAAEVAELVLAELKRLADTPVAANELAPRKLVLTGDFGRDLETTGGLADRVAELYTFNLKPTELNSFIPGVNTVTDAQVREFAAGNLRYGDLIIVGDYSVFKDDLAKRFPNMKIEVVKAENLDLSKDNLQK
ncbi:MAG TPA: pitrilysin family protein [Pyrinomonadaceae bacterium]|jgi:zinc protease